MNYDARATPLWVIGRAEEKKALLQFLSTLEIPHLHRALLIDGPPGSGKSTLARWLCRCAQQRDIPTHWVSYHTAKDSRGVAAQWLQACGVRGNYTELDEQFFEVLAHLEPALIVLDNIESHFDLASRHLGLLAKHAARHLVVATSRRALDTATTRPLTLGGLSPEAAVALYVQRGQQRLPSSSLDSADPELAHLVSLLGFHPLAIELASSYHAILSPGELAQKLQSQEYFALLTAQLHPEQGVVALDALLEHSWAQLSPLCRDLLAVASVFVGGFSQRHLFAVFQRIWSRPELTPALQALREAVDSHWIQSEPMGKSRRFSLHSHMHRFLAHYTAQDSVRERELRNGHAETFVEWGKKELFHLMGQARSASELDMLFLEQQNINAAREWAWQNQSIDNALWLTDHFLEYLRLQTMSSHASELLIACRPFLPACNNDALRIKLELADIDFTSANTPHDWQTHLQRLDALRPLTPHHRITQLKLKGRIAWWSAQYSVALEALEEAFELLVQHPHRALAPRVFCWLALALVGSNLDLERAYSLILRSIEQAPSKMNASDSHFYASEIQMSRNQIESSFYHATQSLKLVSPEQSLPRYIRAASRVCTLRGSLGLALEHETLIALIERVAMIGELSMACWAAQQIAWAELSRAHYAVALAWFDKAIAQEDELGWPHSIVVVGAFCCRWVLGDLIDPDELDVFEASLSQEGAVSLEGHLWARFARCLLGSECAQENLPALVSDIQSGMFAPIPDVLGGLAETLSLWSQFHAIDLDVFSASKLSILWVIQQQLHTFHGAMHALSHLCIHQLQRKLDTLSPRIYLPETLPRHTLQVHRSGHWFQVDQQAKVLVGVRSQPTRRLLAALAEARTSAKPYISQEEGIDIAWPGERMLAESAQSRWYMCISNLRKRGLHGILLTHEQGYVLAEDVALVRGV